MLKAHELKVLLPAKQICNQRANVHDPGTGECVCPTALQEFNSKQDKNFSDFILSKTNK